MSYIITKKLNPKGVEFILFHNKNEITGLVNFSDMELNTLSDINEKVINAELFSINFPISDHYYTMEYKSKNGWTLKKPLDEIHKPVVSVRHQYSNKYSTVAKVPKRQGVVLDLRMYLKDVENKVEILDE